MPFRHATRNWAGWAARLTMLGIAALAAPWAAHAAPRDVLRLEAPDWTWTPTDVANDLRGQEVVGGGAQGYALDWRIGAHQRLVFAGDCAFGPCVASFHFDGLLQLVSLEATTALASDADVATAVDGIAAKLAVQLGAGSRTSEPHAMARFATPSVFATVGRAGDAPRITVKFLRPPTWRSPEAIAHDARDPGGYGGIGWGATRAEVTKGVAGVKPEGEVLGVRTVVAGLPAMVGYYFTGDALSSVGVLLAPEHSAHSLYVDDYERLRRLMAEKYGAGEPAEKWREDTFRGDDSARGMAVAAGHLFLATLWEFPTTRIALACNGDNFKITLVVRYESVALSGPADDAKRAADLKGL